MFPNFYQTLLNAGLPVTSATDDGACSFSRGFTDAEALAFLNIVAPLQYTRAVRANDARAHVASLPNWATWDYADWTTWYNANISNTQINAITSLAQALPVLRLMSAVLNNLALTEIALRNHDWPEIAG